MAQPLLTSICVSTSTRSWTISNTSVGQLKTLRTSRLCHPRSITICVTLGSLWWSPSTNLRPCLERHIACTCRTIIWNNACINRCCFNLIDIEQALPQFWYLQVLLSWLRLVWKQWIHLRTLSLEPICCNLNNLWCGTLSKAIPKSKLTASVCSGQSISLASQLCFTPYVTWSHSK